MNLQSKNNNMHNKYLLQLVANTISKIPPNNDRIYSELKSRYIYMNQYVSFIQ